MAERPGLGTRGFQAMLEDESCEHAREEGSIPLHPAGRWRASYECLWGPRREGEQEPWGRGQQALGGPPLQGPPLRESREISTISHRGKLPDPGQMLGPCAKGRGTALDAGAPLRKKSWQRPAVTQRLPVLPSQKVNRRCTSPVVLMRAHVRACITPNPRRTN